MNFHLISCLAALFALGGLAAAQSETFTLATTAVSGGPETGFDSGLVSVGRLDAIYGSKPGDPPKARSFPFSWSGLPEGTKALAVFLEDPDAKPVIKAHGMEADFFLHWIATDIDPASGGLPDNAAAAMTFAQGRNGRGQVGYTAPQPPADVPKDTTKVRIHIYRLMVFALSAPTGLKSGFTLTDLQSAIRDKTLAKAELDVSYSNQ